VALPPVHRNWWQSHQAEPGNEIVSIISTPYRDVYNDKGSAWECILGGSATFA